MIVIESGDTLTAAGAYKIPLSPARESWYKLAGTWNSASIAVTDAQELAVETHTDDGGNIVASGGFLLFTVTGTPTGVVVSANDLD